MAFNVRRLCRKPSGTFYLRILIGPQASTPDGSGRYTPKTSRGPLLDAIGGNIRTWTIGPEGISAEPGKDTEALLQAVSAHPELLRATHATSPAAAQACLHRQHTER